MLLDLVGGTLLAAVVTFNIHVLVSALAASPFVRRSIVAIAGAWLGLQIALAYAGAFTSQIAASVPLIGLMVVAPLFVVGVAATFSPAARAAMLGMPLPLLIGLNAGRVFGAFFLLLAADGRLGGPFPQSAGWGDVLVGILAVPLAIQAAKGRAKGSVTYWNVLGAVDLVAAVALGTLSFNGFALQAIDAGPGSDAVQHLPWSLIPTVLVPFYLFTHALIFAKLRYVAAAA